MRTLMSKYVVWMRSGRMNVRLGMSVFLAVMTIGSATVCAQKYPVPTPEQQQGIDKDISRHFGDSPADPGPIATDLSAAITPAAIDAAARKVADWQLARAEPHFDRIWT